MFRLLILAICGINIYSWWRLRGAFMRNHPIVSCLVLCAIISLLLAPAWMRMFFNHGEEPRFLIQTAWIWLALSFWLSTAFFACDLWNIGNTGIRWILSLVQDCPVSRKSLALTPAVKAWISLGFTAAAALWGMIEAGNIKINRINLETEFLPEGNAPFKLLLLSDIHAGPAASTRRMEKIITLANAEQPNLILSAGDFMDGSTPREDALALLFQKLRASSGCYAVYGNHDVYTGLDYSRQKHSDAGFTLLENSGCLIDGWLHLYGENDPAAGNFPGAVAEQPPVPATENTFNILLKHRPDPPDAPGFNLQLSGHSHGGQIFPFNCLVRLRYPYKEGKLHTAENGTMLYVSRGTGVWGPPFRFLAQPEITVFTFTHKQR